MNKQEVEDEDIYVKKIGNDIHVIHEDNKQKKCSHQEKHHTYLPVEVMFAVD